MDIELLAPCNRKTCVTNSLVASLHPLPVYTHTTQKQEPPTLIRNPLLHRNMIVTGGLWLKSWTAMPPPPLSPRPHYSLQQDRAIVSCFLRLQWLTLTSLLHPATRGHGFSGCVAGNRNYTRSLCPCLRDVQYIGDITLVHSQYPRFVVCKTVLE